MATTEERVDKLGTKFQTLAEQVSAVVTKVDYLAEELKQQREDIRRLNERQDAAQAQHNADMKEIREDIKGAVKHIQNLTIATMVGIMAITIATWVFVLTDARNETPPPQPAQSTQYQPPVQAPNYSE